jgi:hypothetical protein
MSETVIIGSIEIWRQNPHEIQPGTREEANALIQEEAEQLDRAASGDANADAEVEINEEPDHQDEEGEFEGGTEVEVKMKAEVGNGMRVEQVGCILEPEEG